MDNKIDNTEFGEDFEKYKNKSFIELDKLYKSTKNEYIKFQGEYNEHNRSKFIKKFYKETYALLQDFTLSYEERKKKLVLFQSVCAIHNECIKNNELRQKLNFMFREEWQCPTEEIKEAKTELKLIQKVIKFKTEEISKKRKREDFDFNSLIKRFKNSK